MAATNDLDRLRRTGGLFITGTDTGVGKTQVGAALVRALTEGGLRVAVRKPVESGCEVEPALGRLLPADAAALRGAAGNLESLEAVCPFRFRAALAPDRAASLEHRRVGLEELVDACPPSRRFDLRVVEGAGGLLSPLCGDALNADLAVALGLPVLLVAADRLGCINHVLLSMEALLARQLSVAGVVLNDLGATGAEPAMDNLADLRARLSCPVEPFPVHGGNDAALRLLAALRS